MSCGDLLAVPWAGETAASRRTQPRRPLRIVRGIALMTQTHPKGKFHQSSGPSMNKDEFARIVRAGFDLGAIARSDVAAVLTLPPGAPLRGFWGSGAKCPTGTYVAGVRLKIRPLAGAGHDDTGLNGVGLKCGGGAKGAETKTVEGPDGTWTAWADCPEGQRVYSIRSRSQPYAASRDNAGTSWVRLGGQL